MQFLASFIVIVCILSSDFFFTGASTSAFSLYHKRIIPRFLPRKSSPPRLSNPNKHLWLMKGGGSVGDDRKTPGLFASGLDCLNEVVGENSTSLWNVPNILTLLRLACVPILVIIYYVPISSRNLWCSGLFAGAAFTDWLDGWWARKFNISSPFGAFLDPVADKLIVAVALILLCERLGSWMTVCTSVILCREIGVSALREWMAQIGARGVVKVGLAGKCKTAIQMISITLLLFIRAGDTPSNSPVLLFTLSKWLLILSTVLTVTSGSGYLRAAWPTLTSTNDSKSI